jgi:hypothetical protein
VIGEFTNLHRGSKVSFTQQVSGRVANIPNGMDIWLVVLPVFAPGYWPQPGPVVLDPHGQFHAFAYFGNPAIDKGDYKGEKFILMIVEASPVASQQFRHFKIDPQGLPGLPAGITVLTEIMVIGS